MRAMGLQAIYQAPRTTTNALPLMETRIVNNSGPVSGSHHVCGARFFREAMSSSVVSHKYAYESAGPFGRRLRCSSSRGNGHTGGFETRPYKSSRLADDQNALASS